MVTKCQGKVLILSLWIVLCVGELIGFAAAQESEPVTLMAKNEKIDDATKVSNATSHLENHIDNNIQQTIASQEEKIKQLEGLITEQRNLINDWNVDFKSITDKSLTSGITFEVWCGILLACVSIMVTILSIVLVFLNYIGFKNAKEESIREAREY